LIRPGGCKANPIRVRLREPLSIELATFWQTTALRQKADIPPESAFNPNQTFGLAERSPIVV
jgi:hypothetical protein